MPDETNRFKRLKARATALLAEHWHGAAGERLRETVTTVSEYSQQNVRIKEKLQEAPTIVWETLKEKSSRSLVNAAEEEERRISAALARRTLADKARQEKATADKLESDARLSKIAEMEARLRLLEKLRQISVVPVWDEEGRMIFLKAPAKFSWDELANRLITASDLEVATKVVAPQNVEGQDTGDTLLK